MSKPRHWSTRSDDFRIEAGRSRLLTGCLAALGPVGAACWWMSAAPALLAAAGSSMWIVVAASLARREWGRATRSVVLGAGAACIDGRPVDGFSVDWRGMLTILEWRDSGRAVRWLLFPDVVDAAQRRELRLWALARRERGSTAAVAP